MKANSKSGGPTERGIALLIALFVLVLISGVAISLIVMAGSESSLAGNYRYATNTFLAAQGGLEEGRERLMPGAPDTLVPCPSKTAGGCTSDVLRLAALTATFNGFFDMALPANIKGLYIVNPAAGDPAIDPSNQSPTNPYRDAQYRYEFGANPPLTALGPVSDFGGRGTTAAVAYKWVRITYKTELSTQRDYNGDGIFDANTPVFFDSQTIHQRLPCCPAGSYPGLTCNTSPTCRQDEIAAERSFLAQLDTPLPNTMTAGVAAVPVYRVTALAVGQNNSRRLLQYEVARLASVSAMGAVVSQASVTTNGTFQVFGSYPPVVTKRCRFGAQFRNVTMCTTQGATGALVDPPCPGAMPPQPPQCCFNPDGSPKPCGDYCGTAPPVDGIASGGSITINGQNTVVPDTTTGCSGNQTCVLTRQPMSGLAQNQNLPYDLNEIVQSYSSIGVPSTNFYPDLNPPAGCTAGGVTTQAPGTSPFVSCTYNQARGTNDCQGTGAAFGQLPTPWPPATNTQPPYTCNVPQVVYTDGNLRLQGHSAGSGILVVNGDLDIGSGFNWFGLIIVKGVVSFSGGGGASSPTNIIGSVIAGQNVLNNNTTVGGGVNIIYDSCAFKDNSANAAYRVLSFRELTETAR